MNNNLPAKSTGDLIAFPHDCSRMDSVDLRLPERKPGFWASINPMETVRHALDIKLEVKRLETEKIRIAEEAQLKHHVIDSATQSILADMDHRRHAMEAALSTALKFAKDNHQFRIQCLTHVRSLTHDLARAKDPDVRLALKSFIDELLAQSRQAGDHNLRIIDASANRLLN